MEKDQAVGHQTQSTQENMECVKARLQEEGREARNLIAYSLPLQDHKWSSYLPLSGEKSNKLASFTKDLKKLSVDVPQVYKKEKRHRSASAGRDPQASLRARHWGFLFRNLEQAVDEIYQTAEDDESIVECKEAILMLERYANDFYKLIEWLKIKWEYENTSPPERPTSLTWEIRTSSPGKALRSDRRILTVKDAKRVLHFDPTFQSFPKFKKKEDKVALKIKSSDDEISNPVKDEIEKVVVKYSDKKIGGNVANVLQFDEMRETSLNSLETKQQEIGSMPKQQEIGSMPKLENTCFKKSCHLPSITENSSKNDVAEKVRISETKNDLIKGITYEPYNPGHHSVRSASCCQLADNSDLNVKKSLEDVPTFINHDPTPFKSTICESKLKSEENEERKGLDDMESKKGSDSQAKSVCTKQHPLVNMNKASQVRKAFNQSKTPVREQRSSSSKGLSVCVPSDMKSFSSKQSVANRFPTRRIAETKSAANAPLCRKAFAPESKPISNKNICCSTPQRQSLQGSASVVKSSNEKPFFVDGKCPSNSSIASSCNTSSSGQSWADKVKGKSLSTIRTDASQLSLFDEDEGWEVVRRNRRRSHGGSSTSLNSHALNYNKNYHNFEKSTIKNKGIYEFKMKTRFHQPSSTMSMPSLALYDSNNDEASNRCCISNASKSCCCVTCHPKKKEMAASLHSKSGEGKHGAESMGKKMKLKGTNSHNELKRNKDPKVQCSHIASTLSSQLKCVSNSDKYRKDVTNVRKQNELKVEKTKFKIKEHLILDSKCSGSSKTCSPNTSSANSGANEVMETCTFENKIQSCNDSIKEGSAEASTFLEITYCDSSTLPKSENVCHTVDSLIDSQDLRDSDSESEREEEQMRSNAAAFESVVKKEEKLKQQIEEAKRDSLEVCGDIEEVEDDDGNYNETAEVHSCENSAVENFYHYDPVLVKLSSLSWADQMDAIEKMESVRPPGRVLHIHEKLSSPSRKLPISEKFRRHKEKLAKAQELRGKLILAKTEKLKDLFRKIDEVNIDKERLLSEKRDLFERKMERAEEKRRCHLQEIVNKAHDEENKAREIAFINGLEAQNKLHDILQQHQSHESRLADMAEERCRKQEEKAAKEVAAQERRKALEAERQARMVELCEKRRKRFERIDRQQAERREELLEQAREKARDREERLTALQQAQQAKECELVKKIQQKQEETARRHEENIEQIRQRALESSIMKYSRGCDDAPKLRRYETKKLCTLCNSLIASEVYLLSHLRGKYHQEALKELHKRDVSVEESETYNLKFIINAPANTDDPQLTQHKERQKALKKRCRKIRTRMITRGKEFLKSFEAVVSKDTSVKGRLSKSLTQISKLIAGQGLGPWPTADVTLLDRHLLELLRILDKFNEEDQCTFAALDGFGRLMSLMALITDSDEDHPCVVPARSLVYCARVMLAACHQSHSNCHYFLYSNHVGNAVDQLMKRLTDLSSEVARIGSSSSLNTIAYLPADPTAAALMELVAQVMQVLIDQRPSKGESEPEKEKLEGSWHRIQDVISYCVSMGVADKISWYFNHVQNPIENDPPSAEIILAAMSLLSALTANLLGRSQLDDPTQLIGTFHVMEACGVVSLLYGLLLHQGGRSPSPPSVNLLSSSTLAISRAATTFLNNLAELDLSMFQAILGSEGISLEFRHIASFLLWYCCHWPCEEVLHNVISLVGYFTVSNKENQMIIQSGETPSVLQQLCSLPWQYFSEPRLTSILFPTLLSCCLHNKDNISIVQQEMSFQVLEDFLKNKEASEKPLMCILQSLQPTVPENS